MQRISAGHLDDELVADAVAILGEYGEAGEVIVDLVLAADSQCRR